MEIDNNQNWKYEYHKLALDLTSNGENSEKVILDMARIVENSRSNMLYKYRAGTLNDILNLSNNKLPFCSASMLNDPFECTYKSNLGELDNDIEKERKERKICSFSERKDNILMWSHYANNHKGFCIEYKFSDLLRSSGLLMPVIYSKKLPGKSEPINIEVIFTKSIDWEYEHEWRIIDYNTRENNEYKETFSLINVPIKPESIYLGCNIENSVKEYLIKYCKNNKIKIYKSEKSKENYGLVFNIIK